MTGVVVVGVDGSAEAAAAVRWALEHARLHGDVVELVYVFPPHGLALPLFVPSERSVPLYEDWVPAIAEEATVLRARQEVQEGWRVEAETIVRSVLSEAGGPDAVPVATAVIGGRHPAEALIDRAANADLLVVGSRGLGGFEGLLLGSVSSACVHHARCPVVIVRARSAA